MRACCDQTGTIRSLAQSRFFRWCLRHLYPGSQYRAGNIGRLHLMQPLNGKPNLILAIGAVYVYADARQSLEFVLVQSKETMCCDGSGWFATQSSGLLRELDEGEKPISYGAHEVSHVLTLPMLLAEPFSPLHFHWPPAHPASIAPKELLCGGSRVFMAFAGLHRSAITDGANRMPKP
jgi:hypothetical protein